MCLVNKYCLLFIAGNQRWKQWKADTRLSISLLTSVTRKHFSDARRAVAMVLKQTQRRLKAKDH